MALTINFKRVILVERYAAEKADYLTFAHDAGQLKISDPDRLLKDLPVLMPVSAELQFSTRLYQGSNILTLVTGTVGKVAA